ncbi:hypothetical protein [Leadbettera azotonutricia]|nr:hypothetical protein [Leadbettera azotonutricia]
MKKIERIAGKSAATITRKELLEAIIRQEEDIAMAEQVVELMDEAQLAYLRETQANADMMSYWSAIEEAKEWEEAIEKQKQQLKSQDQQLKNHDQQIKSHARQIKELDQQIQEMRQMLKDAGLFKDLSATSAPEA